VGLARKRQYPTDRPSVEKQYARRDQPIEGSARLRSIAYVDPGNTALFEFDGSTGEVTDRCTHRRFVTNEHEVARIFILEKYFFETLRAEAGTEAAIFNEPISTSQGGCDNLGSLNRSNEWAADDAIYSKVKAFQGSRLARHTPPPLIRQRAKGVIALPFIRFSGLTVAQKIEFHASCSFVTISKRSAYAS
jgi:hypothetical protein